MNKIMLLLVFLLVIPMVKADTVVLPIINKDQFQSCFFGWCMPSSPAFLLTDINFTYANYSYISVYSNYTNISNYSTYANNSFYLNNFGSDYFYPYSNPFNFINSTYNSSYYLISNPYNFINNSYNATYNAFVIANVSNQSQYCFYVNNATERIAFTSTYNSSYLMSSYNSTYDAFVTANISNNTFYLNGQLSSYYLNINGFNAGNLTSGTIPNGRYNSNVVLTNQTNTYTSNQNFSTTNTSYYLSSASVPTCMKDYNSTGYLIWCDCYNNTHKWVSNTC